MKIYTRTGDNGSTALFGGDRVNKDDLRVEAYGSIDELNSFLGQMIDHLEDEKIKKFNQKIQHILFNMGSIIATVDPKWIDKLPQLKSEDILAIENEIDRMDNELSPMTQFILPSGHIQVSLAHICRTVCRRAERRVVSLGNIEAENPQFHLALKMLNRLSDYFFTLSRYLTQLNKVSEVIWNKEVTLL